MKLLFSFVAIFVCRVFIAQVDSTANQKGIASYYAKKFEGLRCSSGEVFRHDSLTAAHKCLKYGTLVQVRNIKNDSMIIVRINDRLPSNSKRCIDLTRKGAKKLNFIAQGLTPVTITVLNDTASCLKKQ